jgi:adenylate kinase
MQVLLDEAKESYKEEIVKELQSNSVEELEANVNLIANFVRQWKQ